MKVPSIRWGSLFGGIAVGVFLAGGGHVMQGNDEKAIVSVLERTLAILNLENQGINPPSKEQVDDEAKRWGDYALRSVASVKSGHYDPDFIFEPWGGKRPQGL